MLIFDGFGDHMTAELINWCIAKGVVAEIIPPHTSHGLQVPDVGNFPAFKSKLRIETMLQSKKFALSHSRQFVLDRVHALYQESLHGCVYYGS
jgi:hypothetical protein